MTATRRISLSQRSPASVDVNARTAELIAATENPVPRDGALEILVVATGAVDLSRVGGGGVPVLDNHKPGSVADQLGTVTAARIEGAQLIVTVKFAQTPKADEILQNVASGVLRGVSVGYVVLDYKEEQQSQETGDERGPVVQVIHRVTRWQLIEVSLVSIPADGAARVRSQTTADTNTFLEIARRLQVPEADAMAMIRRGGDLQDWRERLLDWRAEQDDIGTGHTQVNPYCERESTTMSHRAGIAEALFLRTRPNVKPTANALPYMERSLEAMLRSYYERVDPSARIWSRTELFKRSMSTSDLPNILANVINKNFQDRFAEIQSPLLRIGRETTFTDFRAMAFAKVSDFPALLEVPEGAEITYGAFSDDREEVSARRFARIARVTREMILNDDLQALEDTGAMNALAIAESRARLLVGLLHANSGAGQTMRDTQPAFHSVRGNVAGSGTAINDTSLTNAAVALRRQVALGGNPVSNEPKFLVVPPEQETVARRQVATIAAPTSTAGVNVFSNLEVLVDPRLTSTMRWWLFSDPARVPFCRFGALQGDVLPQFEAREGWNTDTVEMRIIDYFGAGVIEPRAGFMNPGA